MDFTEWSDRDLEQLAKVYLKHRQHQRARTLCLEFERRVAQPMHSETMRVLLAELNSANVISLAERLLARIKRSA